MPDVLGSPSISNIRARPRSRIFTTCSAIVKQVGRFHVAMYDSDFVRVIETACGLNDHVHRLVDAQRTVLIDVRRKVRSVDELHRQIVRAVRFAGTVRR